MTWADQEKINQFSRLNTRQTEAQSQLEARREEKEQVDEVYEELEMLELNEGVDEEDLDEDDDGGVDAKNSLGATQGGRTLPFKIGDAFVYVTLERGIKLLDDERERLRGEIGEWDKQVGECESGMKALKVHLYAKFGSNISE